jgi:hypothetical protein
LRHIARVITERAKADRPDWGDNTICGVVFYQRGKVCQFSFAGLPLGRRTPHRNALWEQAEAIAKDALEVRNDEPDPSIHYHTNEKPSALKRACAFRREFVPVVKAGRQKFFREASSKERSELAKSDPEACQRHPVQLRPKSPRKRRRQRRPRTAKGTRARRAIP